MCKGFKPPFDAESPNRRCKKKAGNVYGNGGKT